MKRKTAILAALAATLMLGTSASASFAQAEGRNEAHGRPGMRAVMFVHMLQEVDTNKDGKISKEEAQAGVDKRFAEIDADKDGVLIPGEMRKYRDAKREEWRAAREKAAEDGQSADATPATPGPGPDGPRGPRHDGRDGEGRHGKWRDQAEGGPPHAGHGWRHEARDRDGGPGRHGGMRMIRIADTDENGQISKQEAAAMADRMFERMDNDKDGSISADDMPKRPLWHR